MKKWQVEQNVLATSKTQECASLKEVYETVFNMLLAFPLSPITVVLPTGQTVEDVHPALYLEGSLHFVRLFPLKFCNTYGLQSSNVDPRYHYPLVHIPIDTFNGTSAIITIVNIDDEPSTGKQLGLLVEQIKPSFTYTVDYLFEGDEKITVKSQPSRVVAQRFAKRWTERAENNGIGYAINVVVYDKGIPLLIERWDIAKQEWITEDPTIDV